LAPDAAARHLHESIQCLALAKYYCEQSIMMKGNFMRLGKKCRPAGLEQRQAAMSSALAAGRFFPMELEHGGSVALGSLLRPQRGVVAMAHGKRRVQRLQQQADAARPGTSYKSTIGVVA
jgi:hypothetical protein